MNYESRQKGFTLIELLVVISILAIIGAFGFAALVDYDRQQTLKTAARDLRTHLRLAQNKAIVQEKPTACGTNPLAGYRLSFTSERVYQILALCSPSTPPTSAQFTLPQTIRKTAPATDPVNIDFSVSRGTLTDQIIITLTSDFGGSEIITVTQQGVIQ